MNEFITYSQNLFLQSSANLSRRARRSPILALLLDTWAAYRRDEMGTPAAALAYYLLLTLFPLMLLLIALASPFLDSEVVIRDAVRFVSNYLPTVAGELRTILREVVTARGPASLIALLGLLWSASGLFDLVQRGLNRAWQVAQPRPVWRQRLVSIVTVMVIGVLFGLSFVTSAVARAGVRYSIDFGNQRVEVLSVIFTLLLSLFLFAVIYKVFPFARVTWRQVWGSALLASVLWEAAKYIFVWYLLNFARLNLVYGSVGAIIALLVWGYITATILLLGAELSAVAAHQKIETPMPVPESL